MVNWLNGNVGAVQAFVAAAALVVTGTLVIITAGYAKSTRRLVDAASSQLQELIQQRNLLERQIHASTIAEIVTINDKLFQTARPSVDPAYVMRRWIIVVDSRAGSLPPDVSEALRTGQNLVNEVLARRDDETLELSMREQQHLAGRIALETQLVLNAYRANPGHPIPPQNLPAHTADYQAWMLREDHADSSNSTSDA